jgi:mannose-6-phosphate isomerase
MIGPLRFVPYLRPMVWGGRRLEKWGKPLPTSEPYGESWDLSDHLAHASVVASGPLVGQTLRRLMEQERDAILGPKQSSLHTFPWLVKFLDARDWLSVQVHPDDRQAERLWPGEGGKTEAWFVLEAAQGSRIYAGLLPGVNEEHFRGALAAGKVAECLHQFAPRPGDCVFLPAGTVHAVGGGVLMAEVQQTSDATFRLFDWNRRDASGKSRTLHIEEGMACIDWRLGPVMPLRVDEFLGESSSAGPSGFMSRPLVSCEFFQLEYLQSSDPFACGGGGRMQVLIILSGSGRLSAGSQEEVTAQGQVWLLPAQMSAEQCRPSGSMKALLCTLP